MANNTVHYNVEMLAEIKFLYMEAQSVLMDIANRNDPSMLYDEEGVETPSSKDSMNRIVQSHDPEIVAEKKIIKMVAIAKHLMDDIEKFVKQSEFSYIIKSFKAITKEEHEEALLGNLTSEEGD